MVIQRRQIPVGQEDRLHPIIYYQYLHRLNDHLALNEDYMGLGVEDRRLYRINL